MRACHLGGHNSKVLRDMKKIPWRRGTARKAAMVYISYDSSTNSPRNDISSEAMISELPTI